MRKFKDNKNLPLLIFINIILLIGLILAYQYQLLNRPISLKYQACTEEAKICADGSVVVRSGLNCEFTPCPEESNLLVDKSISVFFGNTYLNSNLTDCSAVFPLSRIISGNNSLEQSALQELFQGPTEEEKTLGYTSWFSSTTKDILKSVEIVAGVAYIDLQDIRQLLPNISASCGSAEFLAEIEKTLQQFSEINKVIIALDGQPADFYEFIQMGCTAENNFCDAEPFKKINKVDNNEALGLNEENPNQGTLIGGDNDPGKDIFVKQELDCPTGKTFFEEDCVCPAPWNLRIGDPSQGFLCVGMPQDNLE